MELVALLRILWRAKIAVVVGMVAAVAIGFLAMKSSSSSFGVSSMRVVLDTPRSQTIVANSPNAWTLEWRASLLAELAEADEMHNRIAREMKIAPDRLVITAPDLSVPLEPMPLPQHALDAAGVLTQPYQLSIQAAPLLPIINIDAQAPSKADAARLATAAADAFRTEAAKGTEPDARFVVDDVGPVHAKAIINGPRRSMAGAAAVLFFAAWCSAITVVAAAWRARRRRQLFEFAAA